MDSSNDSGTKSGCFGCAFVLNLFFGVTSVNYVLASVAGKSMTFWAAFTFGIFFGTATIPTAIVCWFLRLCGVEYPFIR